MISIERHEYEDGAFRTELYFLDSSGNALRRMFFDHSNVLICDVLYEYDRLGRNLGGIVINVDGSVHCSFEHIYKGDSPYEWERVERDSNGEIKKRVSYEFDDYGMPCAARFFDEECYVGYCELKYEDGMLYDEQCFSATGMPVESLGVKSLWPI